MPRPSQIRQRRHELIPIVARTFAELGYRRATTAELARRCLVQENILYRLWPDKKTMFVAAIEWVYDLAERGWKDLLEDQHARESAAQRLLAYESHHHGEFGLYRLVFAGLSEADDPQIRDALSHMYKRFQRFIHKQITVHRGSRKTPLPDPALSAWAIVGLGTVANIGRELGLLGEKQRRRLIAEVGRALLDGKVP